MKTMKDLGFSDEEIATMKRKSREEVKQARARLAELGDNAPTRGMVPGVFLPAEDPLKAVAKASKPRTGSKKQPSPSRKTAEKH